MYHSLACSFNTTLKHPLKTEGEVPLLLVSLSFLFPYHFKMTLPWGLAPVPRALFHSFIGLQDPNDLLRSWKSFLPAWLSWLVILITTRFALNKPQMSIIYTQPLKMPLGRGIYVIPWKVVKIKWNQTIKSYFFIQSKIQP